MAISVECSKNFIMQCQVLYEYLYVYVHPYICKMRLHIYLYSACACVSLCRDVELGSVHDKFDSIFALHLPQLIDSVQKYVCMYSYVTEFEMGIRNMCLGLCMKNDNDDKSQTTHFACMLYICLQ